MTNEGRRLDKWNEVGRIEEERSADWNGDGEINGGEESEEEWDGPSMAENNL